MKTHLDRVVAFVLGLVAMVLVHRALVSTWESTFIENGIQEAWFLNSGRAVVATVVALAAVGLLASVLVPLLSKSWLSTAVGMSAGVAVGILGIQLFMGPGNLWPIVTVIGVVFTTPAVFLGVGTGSGIRYLATRRSQT